MLNSWFIQMIVGLEVQIEEIFFDILVGSFVSVSIVMIVFFVVEMGVFNIIMVCIIFVDGLMVINVMCLVV